MELKFEKVYFPCVLLAKKRYCGWKYESLGSKPELECKGIETIRRDSVEAVQKIQDKSGNILEIFFVNMEIKDLESFRKYVYLFVLCFRFVL